MQHHKHAIDEPLSASLDGLPADLGAALAAPDHGRQATQLPESLIEQQTSAQISASAGLPGRLPGPAQ